MEHIHRIAQFILESFIHIWPYLLITIPIAVVIRLSGASKYINRAFAGKPFISILLATIVGAFSPFCSCGVIPVISSLLMGGVPLAPVMSFWIASPSMDPEIFFLSSSVLGWNLAFWRLASTFSISLLSGYITHFVVKYGLIPEGEVLAVAKCCGSGEVIISGATNACECKSASWRNEILPETLKATLLVTKFMGLAFFITAIIKFYVPGSFISAITSGSSTSQVLMATAIGIPAYTSNMTALPLVNGLLNAGISGGAALSFLIAGSTTTLPAMAAVWGITSKRVFLLYITYALAGSLLTGIAYNLFG